MYSRFVELVAKILGFSFKFLSYVSLSVIRQNGESQNERLVFRKMWRVLFSWNTHFEIRHFALLPASLAFNFLVIRGK